jgi:uncharacterized protein affecting Mg2+/Co2+ transport
MPPDPQLGRYLCPIAMERFDVTKVFFLDLRCGDVYCFSQSGSLRAHPALTRNNSGLGMLCWLETLARRVADGTYAAAPMQPGDAATRGLCLFPQRNPAPHAPGPGTSAGSAASNAAASATPAASAPAALGRRSGGAVHTVCASRGVEVSASVLYMPEQGQWTYSISMRLVPPGEPGHVPATERGFETCQLRSRHWAVELGGSTGRALEHVRGDGVVGAFPVLKEGSHRADQQATRAFSPAALREGQWAPGGFVYQSCSGRSAPGGSFGGELTFVPGTLKVPTGEAFEVDVLPFALDVPDFLF